MSNIQEEIKVGAGGERREHFLPMASGKAEF